MRNIVIVGVLLGLAFACGTKKSMKSKPVTDLSDSKVDTIRIENEELEYEIIIYEVGFQSWLATQRPQSYYTQSTLEIKNTFYVMEWNRRVIQPMVYDPNLYMQTINYDPKIDYGMEVNYLLYMYFEFFQQKYNQRL